MFYHWLAPLGKSYIIFNLFNYISFRAAGATVTALVLAFLVGPPVIRRLRARKVGQVIRAEGPASHQGKRGTPTMGGLIILFCTIVPTVLWAPVTNRFVVVAMLSILWMGCIGFLDDYLKIVQGKSRGLVAKWKLAGQVSFGLLLGLFLTFNPVVPSESIPSTATTLPFFKYLVINFAPWLYVLFVTVVITGSSNAVNLTDGLDGLAIGPVMIAGGTYAVFAYTAGHARIVCPAGARRARRICDIAEVPARAHDRPAQCRGFEQLAHLARVERIALQEAQSSLGIAEDGSERMVQLVRERAGEHRGVRGTIRAPELAALLLQFALGHSQLSRVMHCAGGAQRPAFCRIGVLCDRAQREAVRRALEACEGPASGMVHLGPFRVCVT
jgi:hypothetical protein